MVVTVGFEEASSSAAIAAATSALALAVSAAEGL